MSSLPNVIAFRTPAPAQLSDARPSAPQPDVLLGPSAAMSRLWSQVRRVAPYFRTALLLAERGAGAEAVARAMHALSPFAAREFTVLGKAEAERRLAEPVMPRIAPGTLFLPEVEALSPRAQAGLLHLLRSRRPNQVCVIAAAVGELRPLVAAGAFSASLASTLASLQLAVPALRERREDVPALAAQMLELEARALNVPVPNFSSQFFDLLAAENWPGNLAQLQGVLRLALEGFGDHEPSRENLRALMDAADPKPAAEEKPVRLLKLDEVVQEHIRAVLVGCNGNKLRAAEVLGISRSTLYRMLDAQAVHGQFAAAS